MAEPETKAPNEERPFEERRHCQVCGKPGPDIICDHCKIVVQAEALEAKRKVEKAGGGPR